MRTTLNIDDEILMALKGISSNQGRSIGEVVSDLIRGTLKPRRAKQSRNGVPLFESRKTTAPVTLEIVNELRDEE
jgi:negative regulator of replication initiation